MIFLPVLVVGILLLGCVFMKKKKRTPFRCAYIQRLTHRVPRNKGQLSHNHADLLVVCVKVFKSPDPKQGLQTKKKKKKISDFLHL